MPEPLRTVEEQADYLGVPVATLYQWRHRRVGPPAAKVGRFLRYRPEETEKWLDQQSESSK